MGIHPATPLLFAAYLFGLHLARRSHDAPEWRPHRTRLTREDKPDPEAPPESLSGLWTRFIVLAAIMGVSGWVIARAGLSLVRQTGISASIIGGLFTAIATSAPELVTSIAAVRRGALTLAVGDIIGGNCFDVMFAVAADVAYRGGSIYHAVGTEERFLVALTIVMAGVLLMGLVIREKRGIANIGFESFLILALYAGGFLIIVLGG